MISVIVPVYNVKDYVETCIQSLKRQTLKDIEVIVVDDGSTDGSGELVDALCKEQDNFHVYHKENGGLMSAWTFGVRKSHGDYIGFVDSDDYVADDMFEQMYHAALSNRADIVLCDYQKVENGQSIYNQNGTSPLHEGLYAGKDMETIRQYALPNPGQFNISMARWNKLFRRALFLENMKYCACLSKTFEDRYIVPACLFSAERFYYLAKPLNYYVIRQGSNSGMYKRELLSDIHRMYYVQKQALTDKGFYDAYRELYEKAYMDYIHLYVSRNIINVKRFRDKYRSAGVLLKDSLTKQRLKQYQHILQGKMGLCVRVAYNLRCPLLLAIGSYFA